MQPPPGRQATLAPSRVSGIEPLRPLPSLNEYVSAPCVQSLKENVAWPTLATPTFGGAAKLPPSEM